MDAKAAARENLIWRIRAGKHRLDVYDLLDTELDNPETAKPLIKSFADLILSESVSRESMIDDIGERLINRYLDKHPEMVSEEMETIIAEAA